MVRLRIKNSEAEAEYTRECRPHMDPERFRAVCLLVGFALYVVMVCVIAALCGFWALLWLWGFTAVIVLVQILRKSGDV